jgi:hypothetical protein
MRPFFCTFRANRVALQAGPVAGLNGVAMPTEDTRSLYAFETPEPGSILIPMSAATWKTCETIRSPKTPLLRREFPLALGVLATEGEATRREVRRLRRLQQQETVPWRQACSAFETACSK